MDNIAIYWGIIYLILFRISVIVLGGMSIYLGYRLLLKGLEQPAQAQTEQNAGLNAKIGTAHITLKNAAPGTIFALFGAAIVITVLSSQQPDITFKKETSKENVTTSETRMRTGAFENKIESTPIKDENAAKINQEVWKHIKDDLKQLEYANQLESNHPELLDSLASFYFISKDYNKAIETQQKAVNLAKENPHFQLKLTAYQRMLKE
jgi:tetratricopeptide (TPR) repeat protein